MARKPRIHYPGAVYHVILRGNGGAPIFFNDRDRTRFYFLLQEGIERFGQRIHAFCLMSNHVHLAIQVGTISLSRILQNLSFRYTRWINWRRNRTGHLFQGRYKAVLVDKDSYSLELARYIHLNPVRSGMVRNPEEYAWSGHRAYLGLETIPWLTTEWVFSQFSKRVTDARRAYARFIEEGKEEGHLERYHKGSGTDSRILGDEEFVDRVLEEKPGRRRRRTSLEEILGKVCRSYSVRKGDLNRAGKDRRLSEARGMAAWLVLESGVSTLGELSKAVGRDVTTLSSSAKRLQIRSKMDAELATRMREMLEGILIIATSQA